MLVRHRLAALGLVVVVSLSTLAEPGPADAAAGPWGPLQEAGGSTLAVALADGTTALISVGGADDATVYDQRRTATGTLGPVTAITSVDDAEGCRPVEAATALGNFAVAVECREQTGLEDPPITLAELVWTGDDGWVSNVQRDARLGSVDYSPQGQYALFATNSEYGRPHHVTSYHADLGWRDLARRERGLSGDELIAAIADDGDVVALRGAGFEDEPGYWDGGRLRIETYDDQTGGWTQRFDRRYPDGGIDPAGIDVAGGRLTATLVESRSTGQLDGREDRVVVLTGQPKRPRVWSSPTWSRQVLAGSAAGTGSGVGVAAWQAVDRKRTVKSWLATWAPGRARPSVRGLPGRTTLTDATESGLAMDLSVSADGRAALAYVRRQRGADHSTVRASSFLIADRGDLTEQVDATWTQPVETTVDVTASAGPASITIGTLIGPFYPAPETRYSVRP